MLLFIFFLIFNYYYFFIVVDFVIHWNETAMGLHVFPIPIPPPTSLSTVMRIDAFKLQHWRRLLRVPWTARKSNQSILKEINHGYSLEGLMWRADSLKRTLMLGKIEGKRRRGWQRIRWLDSIINSMDMNSSKLQEIVEVFMGLQSRTQFNGYTTTLQVPTQIREVTSSLTDTECYNQYNNNEKAWDISRFIKMWHRGMKWANIVQKMVPVDWYDSGLTQIFNLFFKNAISMKCNEMKCIKQDIPVLHQEKN